jgi:predicted porin
MKKSLVALAALAVVGAASAQSTVTMYGVVDMGVAQLKDSNNTNAPLAGIAAGDSAIKNGVQQGTMSNSRIGFKGTEDLGGGLKANFVYELQTNPDENTQTLTNRLGTVGLSGNFGAVTIGRQYTPYHNVQLAMDLAGNLVATPGYIVNNHNFNGGRASNAVNYQSPSFGGFTAAAQVAAGATATAGGAGVAQVGTESVVTGGTQAEGKNYGLSGIYAAGPLVAGVAYNSMTNPNGYVAGIAPITGSSTAIVGGFGLGSREVKVWAAGASYDFTVVKASLAYSALTDTKNAVGATDLTSNGYNFSIAAPFGATTLVANLGRANLKQDSSNTDGTITGYQLMANYALSKRTTAYAVYGHDVLNTAAAGDVLTRTSTAVGVRHTF